MEKYLPIVEAIRKYDGFLITKEYSKTLEEGCTIAAADMHKRQSWRTLEDIFTKNMYGTRIEHALYQILRMDNIQVELSPQVTYEDRKYDLVATINGKKIVIDTKSTNQYCIEDWFAFNCYDTKNDPITKRKKQAFTQQSKLPGANLYNFVVNSPNTEILVTAKSKEVENGWFISFHYIIHRNVFETEYGEQSNGMFGFSGSVKPGPYYFVKYSDIIRDNLCIKI